MYTECITNWTLFIRDSIITKSIRLVDDGNAEMRTEAVKYSELCFGICIHVYSLLLLWLFFFRFVSCVRFLFLSSVLFQNRKSYGETEGARVSLCVREKERTRARKQKELKIYI